jgi:bifunctional diaminopimelate decarboxylase / aspartate kinase
VTSSSSDWVVVKFGGTSVSNLQNWQSIAAIVSRHRADGARVLIVHSAISGITDRLEKLLAAALAGSGDEALAAIEARHAQLCQELGVGLSADLSAHVGTLRQVAAGVALMGEVSDRTRARVMGMGEIMATEIGARYLTQAGLAARWLDARTVLRAAQREAATDRASYLSATCNFAPDSAAAHALEALGPVVVTQGFIASDERGDTVLLGRGGSDTSAAYFAAKLQARRLEIWTDVPGMFSANPRSMPSARQLRMLSYEEAQEIATAGAKVLHPRCILPARQYQIPLYVLATQAPLLGGTVLSPAPAGEAALVKAVCIKKGVTLVSMDSPGMWHQVGFLADAFQVFKRHGLSVDLVSTSETNVTVTLDPQANSLDRDVLGALVADLAPLCRAEILGPCASVSLVGRNIRGILHQLGDALALFEEQRIYLVSQAANDLNLTFVVDEAQGDRLVDELHDLLVRPVSGEDALGPTWEQLFGAPRDSQGAGGVSPGAFAVGAADKRVPWWTQRREALLGLMNGRDAAYVYDAATLRERCAQLAALKSVARVHYAIKANSHPELLRLVHGAGLKLECVSQGELERVFASVPGLVASDVLFTPNFAPRSEYVWAFGKRVRVTVDNLDVLARWGDLLRGRDILLRMDPGVGRGHHHHVRTGGAHSKFGIPLEQAAEAAQLVAAAGATVSGLHAHAGSGVFDVANWSEVGQRLEALRGTFPDVRCIDVGGGIGVPDRQGGAPFDLAGFDKALGALAAQLPGIQLWIEPGRFVVADGGVLLARVTQVKQKGTTRYVGVATGMNSLIRPALYGAHHDIVNLTRLGEPANELVSVVGPICESADFLGRERLMQPSQEGDVLLIATAGAYGAAMASSYNLRAPAPELILT